MTEMSGFTLWKQRNYNVLKGSYITEHKKVFDYNVYFTSTRVNAFLSVSPLLLYVVFQHLIEATQDVLLL